METSLAREQATAGSKEGVLAAVGTAASAMREKLGESLRLSSERQADSKAGDDVVARRDESVAPRDERR